MSTNSILMQRFVGFCLLFFGLSIMSQIQAQGYNIGIRAGLSQSTFLGPTEANATESFGLNGGFHFGINFQWNFNDVVGVRSEILYNQTGSEYSFFSDDGYYLFDLFNSPRYVFRDTSKISLSHSNAYLSFPQTFHFRLGNKLELVAGGYFSLLLNPVATGILNFGGETNLKEHSFRQGLDFDFNSDRAGEFNGFTDPILIRVNGEDVDLPGIIGAYYFNDFILDEKFFGIDYGLIAGASYYLNRGLYIMLRAEYGLKDITRNTGDVSYQEINSNGSFIYNNDFDRNFGIHLSIGFKF